MRANGPKWPRIDLSLRKLTQDRPVSRRTFLATCAGLGAALGLGTGRWMRRPPPRAAWTGNAMARGHRLRGGEISVPQSTVETGVVIVGGGIAGLSAGWRLDRQGFADWRCLELEDQPGGNSAWGENAVTAYPWGAHYVPIPGREAFHVRELFEELGIIEGYDAAGRPRYGDTHLCAAPQERLFIHGVWQEGLLPQVGATADDRRQYAEFHAAMESLKLARGRDGRHAFCIPVEQSSRDPRFLALDRMTMAQFLDSRGWRSERLRWYVDYCCRDDFGVPASACSAWAGIHYFASRRFDAANVSEYTVLTWPEGNGWIARRLAERLGSRLDTGRTVARVETTPGGVHVDALDGVTGTVTRYRAKAAILAVPRFVARRLVRAWPEGAGDSRAFTYAPWMVSNVTVSELPWGRGAEPCWDNVIYRSPSLGYCIATHQQVAAYPAKQSVLTHYWPLTHTTPTQAREYAQALSADEAASLVLGDLALAHPEIDDLVESVELRLWGHGMVRPMPGFLWGPERLSATRWSPPRVHFAHSDLSGLALFEEAQYRGAKAADAVLRELKLGRPLG